MKRQISLLGACFALTFTCLSATPPPEKLLAGDTLAIFTVPDYPKMKEITSKWPGSLLLSDLSMKPFVDKFRDKVKSDVLAPLERESGVKASEFADLAQGQVTIAVTQNSWDGKSGAPGFILLLDSKNKADALKTTLTNLKKKWVDSGKQIKADKIRDVEFTTLIFSWDDIAKSLEKAFPDPNAGNETIEAPKAKKPGKKLELQIGQSDSLLIIGNSAKDIEKILMRQSGGSVPSLSEDASFSTTYSAQFRDALSYGWVNIKAIIDTVVKQ